MAYYVKYNDIDLTDMIKIREVESTLTPPRENSTINIWEKAGEIYNGYRWDNREITLSFLLLYSEDEYENNPLILEQGLADIKSCFNVDSPKPLYLNDPNKFVYAIPDGDITVEEKRYNCVEITVKFVCYDPFYYSDFCKMSNGTNRVTVYNEGDVPTDPIIEIGIDEDCHFVQLENMANNKKMLIGGFPVVSKTSVAERTDVLIDECNNTVGWSTGSTSIDSDRSTGGTLGTTEKAEGLMCANFGSAGSTTWHGVSARKNLGTNVENFQVEANIAFNSSGTNGDPYKPVDMTHPLYKYSVIQDFKEVQITEGSRDVVYKVICQSLHIRSGPTKSANVVGYLMNGDTINPTEFAGHEGLWGKIGTDRWCYCSPEYVQRIVYDNTVVKVVTGVDTIDNSYYVRNFYTTSSAIVRQFEYKDSKIRCTVPAGEIVRLKDKRIYEDNDNYWYELDQPYKGYTGFIEGSKVEVANNVVVKYPEEPKTADDKVGTIELYGYDSNGVQLFKLSMTDDNQYYEFNYPTATVGGKVFLTDNNIAPEPKMSSSNSVSNGQLVITKDYLLSGKYGNWNDFFGRIGIKRENGYWQAWFIKMEGGYVTKQMWSGQHKVNGSPTSNLSYITIYIGANGDKPCDMSFENITVKNLTPANPTQNNVKKFQKGDVIKVDCYNNRVWLNDKLYNNVEIGSQFFPLEVGENIIRITSDKGTHSSVVFNEKYL